MTATLTRGSVQISGANRLDPPFDDEPGLAAAWFCLVPGRPPEVSAPGRRTPLSDHRPASAPVAPVGPRDAFDSCSARGASPQTRRPDPAVAAHRLVTAALEVLAGQRPLDQLRGRTSRRLLEDLGQAVGRRKRSDVVIAVRVLRVDRPSPDVAEVCLLTSRGRRYGAAAARLEFWRGNWRCAALQIG